MNIKKLIETLDKEHLDVKYEISKSVLIGMECNVFQVGYASLVDRFLIYYLVLSGTTFCNNINLEELTRLTGLKIEIIQEEISYDDYRNRNDENTFKELSEKYKFFFVYSKFRYDW